MAIRGNKLKGVSAENGGCVWFELNTLNEHTKPCFSAVVLPVAFVLLTFSPVFLPAGLRVPLFLLQDWVSGDAGRAEGLW